MFCLFWELKFRLSAWFDICQWTLTRDVAKFHHFGYFLKWAKLLDFNAINDFSDCKNDQFFTFFEFFSTFKQFLQFRFRVFNCFWPSFRLRISGPNILKQPKSNYLCGQKCLGDFLATFSKTFVKFWPKHLVTVMNFLIPSRNLSTVKKHSIWKSWFLFKWRRFKKMAIEEKFWKWKVGYVSWLSHCKFQELATGQW